MRTARVTILMSPEKKAAFEAVAAKRGISTGEFFRQAGDRAANDDSSEEEEELAAMVRELVDALPDMRARLRRSAKRIERNVEEIDRMMRDAGIRK